MVELVSTRGGKQLVCLRNRGAIVQSRSDTLEITRILDWSERVTVLTSDKNKRFEHSKLTSTKVPEG